MSWTKKSKNAVGSSSLKNKIEQGTKRGRILTPDYNRILVGASSDEILIYQIHATFWSSKSRNAVGGYSLKSKIAP